ncbi:metallophosphoesterase family protein [Tersicoccus sp. MR15.9]|uniref:metallophosphoesterase family protein n=1 Tax=Tersicoccus mangrovi TaxID=3121635 RepID=UPI002FE6A477
MSIIYYWSDLHLGHQLVATQRGFATVAEHDAHVLDTWRNRIGPRDTVFVLGDLTMANLGPALAVLADLPGTKHLILGNHDAGHPMHKRSLGQQRRYLDVFATVGTQAQRLIAGHRALISHFPYAGDHDGTSDRYTQWRFRDEGSWLIHGHVHEAWTVRETQINVGVDRWMDGPVPESRIAELIDAGPAHY